jgi:DNA-directed RNA polymerase specialized sigma24 family protein
MTNEEALDLRNHIHAQVRRSFYNPEDADDVTQQILEKLVRLGRNNINRLEIRNATIDVLRTWYGRLGSVRNNVAHALSLSGEDAPQIESEEWSPEDFLVYECEKHLVVEMFSGNTRTALILYADYRFTGEEIADCLGVTPSRVFQMLGEARRRIKRGLLR